ncbi:WD40 repeat domain-containing protein [Kitasatospora sp. NPDC101235]|uniref:WD40 repeat domain-containing protein n=1 Tax=Kitasatospora sp. NPDC101235 TaxID=3364101 RepID=UPI00381C62B3
MTAVRDPEPAGDLAGATRPGQRRRTGGLSDSFPERATLEAVLKGATSPQGALKELLGERQLWWRCCSEAVRTDPPWLFGEHSEELASWIDATATDRPADQVTPAGHVYLLSRVLSAPDDKTENHDEALARLAALWRRSGLLCEAAALGPAHPSGQGVTGLPLAVARRLGAVVERIARLRSHVSGEKSGPDGAENQLVVAALLMAGVKARRRPVVSMPVVFAQSAGSSGRGVPEQGVTGVLELREFPAGPAGLYPDPRAMAGTRSPNGQFAASVGHAWSVAGPGREDRCVLWRIVVSDDPLPPRQIEGPSLGAAFALCLRELLSHPRSRRPSRAWARSVVYGLRPRTAITGALDGGELLLKVSSMEAKLLAARRKGLRLVAPEPNRLDVANASEPGDVRFARTLRQADRYARRFRTGRLITALSLVAAAAVSGLVAQQQGAEARSRLAAAHRLAEVSQSLVSSDAGLAGLFAVQAYRQHADPLTRQALFRAVTASPHLVSSVQASGPISALSSSADGRVVLAGSQGGDVEQWALTGTTASRGRPLGRLPGTVTMVASSSDGGVVAAIDHDTVSVWEAGEPVPAPLVTAGQQPTAVGISPSGRFVAVATTTRSWGVPPAMWVLDRAAGSTGRLDLQDMSISPNALAFPSETRLVLFDGGGYGSWQELALPGPTRTAGSGMGFGTHNSASALAPDGSHFTYSNTASPLPIWPAIGSPDIDKPPRAATTQEGRPAALALSSGGSWAAAAVGTTVYVSRTNASDEKPSQPVALPGAGVVSPHALTFLGTSGSRLLSASGDRLSLWDLAQYSRIATDTEARIPFSCNACAAPRVAAAPDGRSAAVLDGSGLVLDARNLDLPGTIRKSTDQPLLDDRHTYSAVVWRSDGSQVIAAASDGSARILDPHNGFRVTGNWPPLPNPLGLPDSPAVLRFLPGDREVAQLDGSGTIRVRDPATGTVLRQITGPRDMAPTRDGTRALHQGEADLDSRATHAAVILYRLAHETELRVFDVSTGGYRVIDAAGATGLAYVGDQLFVQREGGDLEIWTADGSRRLGTAKGTPGTAVGPVVGGKFIAEKPANENAVRLIDRPSGDLLGTLPLPAGIKPKSTGLSFSADDSRLVTATELLHTNDAIDRDLGRLVSWQLDPNDWIRGACEAAGRDLTPSLWRQYLGTDAPSNLQCTP